MRTKKGKDGMNIGQRRYVKARLAGYSLSESQRRAGYSAVKARNMIEPKGGVVWCAIRRALNKEGMNDGWIAKELKEGVESSKEAITRFNPKTGEAVRDPDLSAHERYINRICKLKGYEREPNAAPQVAVQINNQFPGIEALAHGEAESLINALRAEIVSRQSADVLEEHLGDGDSAACIDMDKSDGKQSEKAGN